ncbi:hypothetical protein M413DRAFT_27218 [Hebeloma cylindrosporum]|uniref:Uncharacterized protein n=1 Tax=Hebeloma cylindrosporum TaxID=76867 RepID=A0A0C3CFS0_HEBCY|nr:hypothetical protein M413DRAFT_27218 [Hebeloma cylindrosporum h7]
MVALCNQCNKNRALRPECCALDGKPCIACTEDIKLENKIKEHEKLIEKIHVKRRALRTVMNRNHDHLLHKLPPEIASQIFIQYAYSQPSTSHKEYSPFTLGAVCQEWRRLAWATPELWCSLAIENDYDDLPQLVAEWLERSGSLPLTIVLDTSRISSHKVDELTAILNKHSARWYDVHFALPASHLHRLCGSSQGNIVRRLVLKEPTAPPSNSYSIFSMNHKPSPMYLKLIKLPLAYVDIIWN